MIANFLSEPSPALDGKLPDFEVTYLDAKGKRAVHCLQSKNAMNALRNFDKAVPRHGRILKVRKT